MQQLNPAGDSGEPLSISQPRETIEADLCVIGAGSGGLSVAAAAAAFGVRVVLIEKHKMGGDCLNYGCVPSKAMIAAGRYAHAMRSGKPFGIKPVIPDIDYAAVNDHVKGVIAAIEPNDSVERFTGLGVTVIQAAGSFIDGQTVRAGDTLIKARRFVIATGSAAFVPPIPGLEETPYFTNETLFDNREKLDHLIIVGGGPIGMEMAQAHGRLGSKVTVLEGFAAMGKDDPELATVVLDAVRAEGVEIREGAMVEKVEGTNGNIKVSIKTDTGQEVVSGTHLLMAVGRKPNLEGLGLEAAGIKHERGGITVNDGLVTSNRKVFAIGDCTGGLQFTHVANYHAGIVIRRALFQMFWAKVDNSTVPWVTYTAPELAHVGLSEEAARKKHGNINVLRWPYHENDRAQAERSTDGLVKVIVAKNGKILGASIVGEHAGELIQMWSLAISQKMKIKAMMGWISPYPTLSEINKRVAYRHYATAASNTVVRKVIGWLRVFG
ncbi:MAG: pyruvate/2-oxoglutarate dehydrogenase complex dihydrolipoamide dehydrogenase (E3) component [Alphaproteobacteria bacterium]|jgi:pyruvate/2-oxoglutarate dehydrogenase complex dihydrolipoamide dehydrogenase (E3) component